VPYNGGAGNIPTVSALEYCSKALQSAKLVACSFEVNARKNKNWDFVYLDPPFSVKARRILMSMMLNIQPEAIILLRIG